MVSSGYRTAMGKTEYWTIDSTNTSPQYAQNSPVRAQTDFVHVTHPYCLKPAERTFHVRPIGLSVILSCADRT